MARMRRSSVALAVTLVLSFGLIAAGVRAHAEYVSLKVASGRLKQMVPTRPGTPWVVPANVRRAEQVMNACFVLGGVGLFGCMIAAITMGTATRPPQRQGFDVIGGKGD